MLWFESGQLLAFLVAASILAVTPGPGVTYVLARTVAGGRGEGVASSFGTAVGGLVHVVAAALGLSAILARSAIAFSLVKYIGACYLVYLGIRMLLAAGGSAHAVLLPRVGARRAFLEGIVTEAFNVKTALFFVAFIPQFVSPIAPAAQYRGRCDRRGGCIWLSGQWWRPALSSWPMAQDGLWMHAHRARRVCGVLGRQALTR